jgi:hypothetical protein
MLFLFEGSVVEVRSVHLAQISQSILIGGLLEMILKGTGSFRFTYIF